MSIDEMIAVLQAAKAGKVIEWRLFIRDQWSDTRNQVWDFNTYEYRVKPEPREFWITKQGDVYIRAYADKASAQAWAGRELVHVREVLP